MSCAGGTRARTRSCINPPPAGGGKHCQGEDKRVETCARDPCPCQFYSVQFYPAIVRLVQTCVIRCVTHSRVGQDLMQHKTQPDMEFSILLRFTQSVWLSLYQAINHQSILNTTFLFPSNHSALIRVTKFGELSPLLHYFKNILAILKALFTFCQNFEPIKTIFYAFWANVHCYKWPNIEQ